MSKIRVACFSFFSLCQFDARASANLIRFRLNSLGASPKFYKRLCTTVGWMICQSCSRIVTLSGLLKKARRADDLKT